MNDDNQQAPQVPQAPRCTMCGSEHITAPTRFRQHGTNSGVCMDFQVEPETWSSTGRTNIRVGRARACLACGYVMLFVHAASLAELRQGITAGWQVVNGPVDD